MRRLIVQSAIPCAPDEVEEPERCLRGRLHIPGAAELLTGEPLAQVVPAGAAQPAHGAVTASAGANLVYALGTLGYDFGSEARRDAFTQRMPAVAVDATLVPANPYDARQMVDYLGAQPAAARALIWTLILEGTPIYALQPTGPFAADVYALLRRLLAGQMAAVDSAAYIERASIPGRLTDRSVRLFSRQAVPVVTLQSRRGLYGWQVNTLVRAALDAVRTGQDDVNEPALQRALQSFLHRIYYDLHTEGRTARDRALNFAATNAFQAATTFVEAVGRGLELDRIEVGKSPFCRIDSDCWDVKLTFFDPDNHERARRVFHFTIDVVDRLPVTVGEVRAWSAPP